MQLHFFVPTLGVSNRDIKPPITRMWMVEGLLTVCVKYSKRCLRLAGTKGHSQLEAQSVVTCQCME